MARRRYRNPYFKFGYYLVIIALIVDVASLAWPLRAVSARPLALNLPASQAVNLAWPDVGEAAIGAAGYGLLAQAGGDKPLPTASVEKILTALAVLSKKPLKPGEPGPVVTMSQADVDTYQSFSAEDGSVVPVAVGEQLTEREMLEAMLLPSANNMAVSLADWAFGSTDAFNTYANGYAKQLGLTATTVTDPSGFDPTTVSTAKDLTKLASVALANPTLTQIVAEPSSSVPLAGEIKNLNNLLGSDGVIGIKTGNTDQAGGVFMFATNRVSHGQTVQVYGAVMAAPSLHGAMDEGLALLKSADANFGQFTLSRGKVLGYYQQPNGTRTSLVAKSSESFIYWRDKQIAQTNHFEMLAPGAKTGAAAGSVELSSGEHSLSVPVITQAAMPKPSIVWRLLHP